MTILRTKIDMVLKFRPYTYKNKLVRKALPYFVIPGTAILNMGPKRLVFLHFKTLT